MTTVAPPTAPAELSRDERRRLSAGTRAERRFGWMLCAPAVIVMAAVAFYPIGYAIYLSLQRYDLRFPQFTHFVGLSNYGVVLSSGLWWRAFAVTVIITVVSVAVELVLGMALAMLLHRTPLWRGLVRTSILIPYGIVTVAAAYSWQDLSTDRTVLVGAVNDHLTAKFQAQGVGGRIEAGYRVAVFDEFGVTPYAAGQAQSLRLPSYSETDASGLAAFALSYGAKTTTDSRSELGARFDTRFMTGDQSRLILRARAAWAHDFSAGPSANATFQTLPGFGFTVFGAAPDRDSALTSASAEYKLGNGVSFLAKFDGQFGDTTRVYAGTGAVRVAW